MYESELVYTVLESRSVTAAATESHNIIIGSDTLMTKCSIPSPYTDIKRVIEKIALSWDSTAVVSLVALVWL